MNEVRRRLARGLVRATVAAMAMTGVRQVTTGLGLVEQTPPDAIIKQRPPGLLVRMPRLVVGLWCYVGATKRALGDRGSRQDSLG